MFCQAFQPTSGGDEEDRTPDPLLAKQVLSQLSYTPMFHGFGSSLCVLKVQFPGPSKLNNIGCLCSKSSCHPLPDQLALDADSLERR